MRELSRGSYLRLGRICSHRESKAKYIKRRLKMAHHSSSESDEALRRLFAERMTKGPELGATGLFPEGKLTGEDEGEIKFAIANAKGKVLLDFGTPVVWMGLLPDQADAIARTLVKHAKEARDSTDG